jgi:hypothetical protein
MSGWFQLGPDEIAQRARAGAGGGAVHLPSMSESIARGIAGYTVICFGIGFGAALGFAFHVCQRAARERLK